MENIPLLTKRVFCFGKILKIIRPETISSLEIVKDSTKYSGIFFCYSQLTPSHTKKTVIYLQVKQNCSPYCDYNLSTVRSRCPCLLPARKSHNYENTFSTDTIILIDINLVYVVLNVALPFSLYNAGNLIVPKYLSTNCY